ncbi:hypothetical protein U1Q18_005622 [Sarracenia purpurea var. burkii]
MDREFHAIVTLGNGVRITGASLYPGTNSDSGLVPIVFLDACDSEKGLNGIGHKIVLCRDKNDTLGLQVYNVQNANVAGGIFITNNSDLQFSLQSTFPAVFLNLQDGETVLNYAGNGDDQPKGRIEFKETSMGTKPAPKVAGYSSRGPSQSCPFVLKPDLIAPGTFILASWPENIPATYLNSGKLFNSFNLLSGTSMSSPHAAGVAALLKAVHPEWSAAAIRSAMMTTSYSTDNAFNPIQDIGNGNQPATPLDIGAGHVDPNRALDPGLIYDIETEDYVNLLCALNYTMKQIDTITRRSSSSFTCSNPSLDLNYPSFIAFFNSNDSAASSKTVKEFRRTVTNVGEAMTSYTAKLAPLEGFEVRVVPEKLVFREKNEKQSYKVSIEGPRMMNGTVAFVSLSWVEDEEGKHIVRSPIVATSLSSEFL